ncbi:hypothetical protein SAMN05443575_4085 [Jatrophihabitans endophyticus]|uniref:Nif11 domain-containing protein n=1 Tax=Jatrophihabitans endophyticus TaxID=1206085 RepID=A0A1M5TZ51_9ACTN|nr:hypothetical protein [Jatrophihabitans endophyticus]SHH56019.1 hypothetical protein SAMN05443575_4085 [Jatrophihabitans endophyticus]
MSQQDAVTFLRRLTADPQLADAVVAAMKSAVTTVSAAQGLTVSAADIDAALAGAQKGGPDAGGYRNCWGWHGAERDPWDA